MGQAKLRGDKATRIANALIAKEWDDYERERAKAARWAKLTPAQKDAAL
jgi:hypothetical protein